MQNYIFKIEKFGKLIILNDSSKWEVSISDISTAAMWSQLDNVSVSGDKMTNLERKETVSVKRKS